jgi:transposase
VEGESRPRVPRVSKDHILNAFRAGPEAVASLIEYIQDAYQEVIDRLTDRIEALEKNQSKDSSNSNKPPSSDGLAKRTHRSTRQPSGKKPGGQPGHEGTTLRMVSTPDEVHVHELTQCEYCGKSLQHQRPVRLVKRQVFEIPEIAVKVSEHQAEVKQCPRCEQESMAAFPQGVENIVQYGTRVKTFATYLKNYALIPYGRAVELFRDLFGLSISQGTLAKIDRECSRAVSKTTDKIKDRLIHSAVAHFDETGLSIEGNLAWLHSCSTSQYTNYEVHSKRGGQAMEAIGVLPQYHGVAIHDHWKPYNKYDCRHGFCNAHHIRELKFVIEQHHQSWAQKMINLLVGAKQMVEEAKLKGKRRLGAEPREKIQADYREILGEGRKANPPPPLQGSRKRGRPRRGKITNLLDRLCRYERETLRFTEDFRVPFDNNLAERDIRMVKVQQKVSGTFRSWGGATAFCKIRGYISTVRKSGCNVIEALSAALAGQPFRLLSPQEG